MERIWKLPTRSPSPGRNPPAELPPRSSHRIKPEGFVVLGKAEYQQEYSQLIKELFGKFAIEDTPYDRLLESMNAAENEMNGNGGANWNDKEYVEYLDFIRQQLTADSRCNSIMRGHINWSIDEISVCGKELEERGQSSRNIGDPMAFLIGRVVEWCRTHPPTISDDDPPERYE